MTQPAPTDLDTDGLASQLQANAAELAQLRTDLDATLSVLREDFMSLMALAPAGLDDGRVTRTLVALQSEDTLGQRLTALSLQQGRLACRLRAGRPGAAAAPSESNA